jgi:hypothetical protein
MVAISGPEYERLEQTLRNVRRTCETGSYRSLCSKMKEHITKTNIIAITNINPLLKLN